MLEEIANGLLNQLVIEKGASFLYSVLRWFFGDQVRDWVKWIAVALIGMIPLLIAAWIIIHGPIQTL